MDAVLPLVSIGLGIGLFGEYVRTTALGLVGAAVGMVLLVSGIVALDTSSLIHRQQRQERQRRGRGRVTARSPWGRLARVAS